MTQDPNPHEALASIKAARAGLAVEDYPVGYDLFYGAVCGLLVASQGVPQPWSAVLFVFSMLGLAACVTWWRKRVGWWVNGYGPRRARWVAFALVVVLLGLMGLSLYGRFEGPWWLFIVAGALAAVASAVGGRIWMRVWRRELKEGV